MRLRWSASRWATIGLGAESVRPFSPQVWHCQPPGSDRRMRGAQRRLRQCSSLTGSGMWLLLRPRTFQVIVGLSLLSYAVNLFIFSTGGLRTGAEPILEGGQAGNLAMHADPVPQALVLTAIVIGFATTALFLVVLLASRGLTGSDHVDGKEKDR